MQIISHRRHATNIGQAERIASAVAGGFLAVTGLERRSLGGAAVALIGGELLWRALTGRSYAYELLGIRTAPKGQGAETTSVPYELGVRVDESIVIAKPRQSVFRFWRNLSNFPRFMKSLDCVSVNGNHSHWVVQGPAGTVKWEAVVYNEIDQELIAWRSLPGSDVDHAGSVTFRKANGGSATEVTVQLQYNPPGGAVAAVLASMSGKEPSQQIAADLRELKRMFESGEIAANDYEVEVASEDSFPASDAPGYHP
jgi:uncharacterized membrane protein